MGAVTAVLALGLLVGVASPGAAADGFEIRPLVHEGDAAPGGARFTSFGQVRINDTGEVLFEAVAGGRRGLFLATEGRVVPIAVQEEPTPLGGRYLQLSYVVLNDRPEIAFVATIVRGWADESGAASAILVARGAGVQPVVTVRDLAPGRGTFKEFRDLAIDAAGRLAFVASLDDGDRPGGLFVAEHGRIRRLVAVLDPAPDGGRFKEISAPSLGPDEAVAFHATVVEARTRAALFVAGGGGELRRVVAQGDRSPIGGTFTQLANPEADRGGNLYFWGEVEGGRFPAALFFRGRDGLRAVASRGARSPAGHPYAYLGLNFSAGKGAAFQAALAEGGAGDAAIFVADAARVRVVVRTGQRASTGDIFGRLEDPAINAAGSVAFVASTAGRDAIWVAVPSGAP